MNILRELLLKKYAHLESCYNSRKEFEEHFFSGEVTIPAKDLLDLPIEIEETTIYYRRRPSFFSKIFGRTTKPIISMDGDINDGNLWVK